MRKIVIVMLSILFLETALAQSYVFQRNIAVDLKVNCISSLNTPCNSLTNCYITIHSPQLVNRINNQTMSYNITFFNYTLNQTLVGELGKYQVFTYCTGNTSADTRFTYLVTETGEELTTGQSTLYIVFFLGAGFVFLITLYGALKIPFRNEREDDNIVIKVNDLKYVKIFLMVMSYVLFLFLIGLLRGVMASYLTKISVGNYFNVVYFIMLGFLYPILVISVLVAFITFIEDLKIKKALQRELPTR